MYENVPFVTIWMTLLTSDSLGISQKNPICTPFLVTFWLIQSNTNASVDATAHVICTHPKLMDVTPVAEVKAIVAYSRASAVPSRVIPRLCVPAVTHTVDCSVASDSSQYLYVSNTRENGIQSML